MLNRYNVYKQMRVPSPVFKRVQEIEQATGLDSDEILNLLFSRDYHEDLLDDIVDEHGKDEYQGKDYFELCEVGTGHDTVIDSVGQEALESESSQFGGDHRRWVTYRNATESERLNGDVEKPENYQFHPPIDD